VRLGERERVQEREKLTGEEEGDPRARHKVHGPIPRQRGSDQMLRMRDTKEVPQIQGIEIEMMMMMKKKMVMMMFCC